MHIQNHETHVSDNNVARTTVVSSDSVEQRIRNTKVVKNKQMLMNRLNWITYLKILYDQLEKKVEQAPIKKKSFLPR
jgi:hypothetical protein